MLLEVELPRMKEKVADLGRRIRELGVYL